MVSMIKAILEFQVLMNLGTLDDTSHIIYTSSWWLFTKYMKTVFQAGNGCFWIDVVGQANEQNIEIDIQ